MKHATYRVILERDESGAWIAWVPRVRGCHTYGRTLEQARRRIREALGLWIEDAKTVELVEEVRLPAEARDAIRRSRRARKVAEEGRVEAQAATREAAQTLVQELDLGVRDAGELLGLSHQRIQQLIRSEEQPRHWTPRGVYRPGPKPLSALKPPPKGPGLGGARPSSERD